MSRTSTMAALQSGQRPRPARSSRAQARQKVWPQGMKAAPLARAMHTQQHPATTPLPGAPGSGSASSSGASGSAASASASAYPSSAAPTPALHCRSVCSRSAIRDTLSASSSTAAAGAGGGGGAGAGQEAVVGDGRDTARRTRGSPAPSAAEIAGGWSSRMMSSRVRGGDNGAAGACETCLSAAMADASVTAARRPAAWSSSSRSLSRSRRLQDPAGPGAGPTAASWSASVTLRRSTRPSIPLLLTSARDRDGSADEAGGED
ncbi:hypothetical protein BS78_07G199800 [Paspalum vaginatum]|nr:hypothetical protein BS78_07G199800 [Paspalum vaginatum]